MSTNPRRLTASTWCGPTKPAPTIPIPRRFCCDCFSIARIIRIATNFSHCVWCFIYVLRCYEEKLAAMRTRLGLLVQAALVVIAFLNLWQLNRTLRWVKPREADDAVIAEDRLRF